MENSQSRPTGKIQSEKIRAAGRGASRPVTARMTTAITTVPSANIAFFDISRIPPSDLSDAGIAMSTAKAELKRSTGVNIFEVNI
jgi:hypothetical protein